MPIDTYPLPSLSTANAVLGYAEMTADSAGITSGTVVTLLTVTVSVPAGRRVRLSAQVDIQSTVGDDQTLLAFQEGGSTIRYTEWRPRIANVAEAAELVAIITPTPGTHTYTMGVARGFSATGTQTAIGTGSRQGHFLVEDITGGTGGSGPIQLGYAEVTANQTGITSLVAVTGLSVAVAVSSGRRIRTTVFLPEVINNTLNQGGYARLFEDGVQIAQGDSSHGAASAGQSLVINSVRTPTAGTHTYTVQLAAQGTGTVINSVSATMPAYLLVEDITGTPMSVENLAWIPYTPTWIATGTAPVLNNGSISGRYTRIGRTIMGIIYHQMGSTTTYGTGNWQWSLPVAPYIGSSPWPVVGAIKGYQSGNSLNALARIYNGTSYLHGVYSATWPGGAETPITNVAPWTWTTSNSLDINFMYEAAS